MKLDATVGAKLARHLSGRPGCNAKFCWSLAKMRVNSIVEDFVVKHGPCPAAVGEHLVIWRLFASGCGLDVGRMLDFRLWEACR